MELASRSSLPPLRFDKPIGKSYVPNPVVDDFLQFDNQQQTSLLSDVVEKQPETQDEDDDDPFSL